MLRLSSFGSVQDPLDEIGDLFHVVLDHRPSVPNAILTTVSQSGIDDVYSTFQSAQDVLDGM